VNYFYPEDVIDGGGKSENSEIIQKDGFRVVFSTDLGLDEVKKDCPIPFCSKASTFM